jgi:hypothetical protein
MSSQSYEDLIKITLDGLREIQKKTPEELRQWATNHPPFPPTIPHSGGRFVFITTDGYSALRKLARTWHSNDPQRSKLLSRKAAEELTVRVFGELLGNPPSVPAIGDAKSELLRLLDERLQGRLRQEHFYFPARVFDQPEVQTFSIGPVTFYRRADWLEAVDEIAGSRAVWKSRVLDRWSNRTARFRRFAVSLRDSFARRILLRWPQNLLAHKLHWLGTTDRYVEELVKAVGPCEWIIDVEIEGREQSRSSECASIAALVALESLGLPMPVQTARNLRGPGDEREPQFQRDLHQIDGHQLSMSTAIDWPRIGGPPGAQAGLLTDSAVLLNAVSCAIIAFVSVADTGNAPLLLQRWVEAMYWFGQARRKRNEFIALVKYGVSLDVLAKGGKAKGILELARALFGKLDGDVFASDGQTLKQVVETVYNDGRSKIAHGGALALLRELPIEPGLAHGLTAHALANYVVLAARYSGRDAYDDFLAAIPGLRAAYLASRLADTVDANVTSGKANG